MDWNLVEGNWKQFRGTVKAKWGRLDDANLEAIAGKRGHLAQSIREAYGLPRDQVELQVKAFEKLHRNDLEPTVVR